MTPQERYRHFANESAELPLCFQPWYLDAVADGGLWDVALVEEKGHIRAVWPYFLKKKYGLPYITMPLFTKWMGPWLVPSTPYHRLTEQHRWIEALYKQLPRVVKMTVDCHPDSQNWLPLYWAGLRQTTRYTYVLDLKDPEQLQTGLNRNVQRNIRKARHAIAVSGEGSIQEFYEINRMSFQRQGIPLPYTFEQMHRHLESLQQRQAVQLFFARNAKGRLCSVAALTWDNRRAYYHLSGDDPLFRDSGSGILLIWEALQYAVEALKVPIFDFEGSMIPSVEAVRRSFGAVQQPYFRLWKPLWGGF